MQIACPQCATRYELDERLLPPTGAPVQCTRCSHVFTAVPPVEDEGTASAKKPAGGVTEGTLVYGTRPAITPAQGIPTSTQVYGRAAKSEGTQLFGTEPVSAPERPDLRMTQPFDPRSTQVFGTATAQERPPDPRSTLVFGHVPRQAPEAPDLRATDPEASARVEDASAVAPAVLDPFDPPGLREVDPPSELDEYDPAAVLETSMRRRRNTLLIAVAVIALGLVGFVGFRWWSAREGTLPAEAIEAQGKAGSLLRRDDPKALDEAVAQLESLTKKWPDHFELRSTQLIALLFQLDDGRAEIARLNAGAEAINAQIAKLQRRKTSGTWQSRINALEDQRSQMKTRLDPLIDRVSSLDARVNRAFRALTASTGTGTLTKEQELTWVRVQAVFHGVKGADQAVVLSERYRQLGGAGGWADLAYAEYALNGRVPPETRNQAAAGLEALRSRDASFIRPWVLRGRLLLANKQTADAIAAFEAATALNPAHAVASDLLEHARRVEAQAAADD